MTSNAIQMSPSAGALIQIQGLTKRYGSFEAVNNLNLRVDYGHIFALLGPNGAGKTTTIRMLMGILAPTSGSARISGLDCFHDRVEVKRRVGYLPDEPVFYDYLRGSEVINFAGEMHGLKRAEIQGRAQPLIHRLELRDALEEFAVNYSRGMKKKLALICAMIHDPELLILDEPTNGLDPFATRVLHEIMSEKAAAGKTIFFSTHLLDQAEKLSSQIAILARGQLAAHGTLAELRAQLANNSTLEEIFFSVAGETEKTAGA